VTGKVTVTVVGAQDRQIESLLRAAGMLAGTIAESALTELAHPSSTPPDVVVLDLRGQPQLPLSLGALKRHHPETTVIIVIDALDAQLMLEAMRSGVSECVTDLTGGDLEAAITRLIAQRASPEAGDVFAFVGARGGLGTTTLAVNVATVLSKSGSSLLIDLHLAGGDAAMFFGVEPRFSIADTLENTHRLDVSFFRGIVTRTGAGPDLLASGDRPIPTVPDAARIRALIDFAARHYRYTVLDLSRSDASALDALEATTSIVIVANQEITTVRAASRLATTLRGRYGKGKVSVVLNRIDRDSEIGPQDVERAIGGQVLNVVPSDYRAALEALNRGRPLVVENHSPVAGAMAACARQLAHLSSDEGAAQKPTSPKSSGLFGRLTGRK
jgi:pilus assembly protein CpaE